MLVAALIGLAAPATASAQDPLPPLVTVAQGGDRVLLRSTVDRWLRAAAVARAGRGRDVPAPDPPRYNDCIAADRRDRPDAPRPRLRRSCARLFKQVKPEVMEFLIQGLWLRGEAARRGLSIDDRTLRRIFAQQKRETFEGEAEYRRYLRRNAMRESMLLYQIRLLALTGLVNEEVLEGVPREEEQAALDAFTRELRARWLPLTTCKRPFLVRDCGNF